MAKPWRYWYAGRLYPVKRKVDWDHIPCCWGYCPDAGGWVRIFFGDIVDVGGRAVFPAAAMEALDRVRSRSQGVVVKPASGQGALL